MERKGERSAVRLSVLDRLIDFEPGTPDRPWISHAESVRLLKNNLKRDLEWLLNTRCIAAPSASMRQLNRSVFVYGLPELTGYALDAPADRSRLLRDLSAAVQLFEPRLRAVRIVPLDDDRVSHALRFRIEGLLLTDSAPEPVSFDTVLELSSGEYQVKGEGHEG